MNYIHSECNNSRANTICAHFLYYIAIGTYELYSVSNIMYTRNYT